MTEQDTLKVTIVQPAVCDKDNIEITAYRVDTSFLGGLIIRSKNNQDSIQQLARESGGENHIDGWHFGDVRAEVGIPDGCSVAVEPLEREADTPVTDGE